MKKYLFIFGIIGVGASVVLTCKKALKKNIENTNSETNDSDDVQIQDEKTITKSTNNYFPEVALFCCSLACVFIGYPAYQKHRYFKADRYFNEAIDKFGINSKKTEKALKKYNKMSIKQIKTAIKKNDSKSLKDITSVRSFNFAIFNPDFCHKEFNKIIDCQKLKTSNSNNLYKYRIWADKEKGMVFISVFDESKNVFTGHHYFVDLLNNEHLTKKIIDILEKSNHVSLKKGAQNG